MICAAVDVTPRAEREFQRAAERVGAYVIDRDVAVQRSAVANFAAEVKDVLEAVFGQVARA